MCEAALTDEKLAEMKEFRKTKLAEYVKLAEALRNDFIAERKLDSLRAIYKKRVQNLEDLYSNIDIK